MLKWTSKHWKWLRQRWGMGFDDREIMNLDMTIAAFVVPRLKRFIEKTNGHPSDITNEEWLNELRDMIYAMECIRDSVYAMPGFGVCGCSDLDHDRIERGLGLFSKRIFYLWI